MLLLQPRLAQRARHRSLHCVYRQQGNIAKEETRDRLLRVLCIIRLPVHHFTFDGFDPFECKRRKGQGRQVTQLLPANFNSTFGRQFYLPHLFNLQAYSHTRIRRLWSSARVPTIPPLAAKLSSLLLCRQVSPLAVRAVSHHPLFPPHRSFFVAESSFCDNEVHSTKCPFTLFPHLLSTPRPSL